MNWKIKADRKKKKRKKKRKTLISYDESWNSFKARALY